MNGKNVLVTGANGHVGFVLTKLLVERGYNVRASVRDKENKELTKNLSEFDVDIVSLNLMHPETIGPAMENIDGVFQVAAVYKSWAKKPEEEIINPSIIGGINVLKAAYNAGVKKIIFTSSTAAVGRSGPNGKALTEKDWNSKSKHPYSYAKTEAERRAWDFSKEMDMEMVVMNPTAVIGPYFHRHTPSTFLFDKILKNELPRLPPQTFGYVDVRDVASLELLAMTKSEAAGKRFVCSAENMFMKDQNEYLSELFPESASKIPKRVAPNWLIKFLALFLPALKMIAEGLGKERSMDSSQARKLLGWNPRSAKEAVKSAAESAKEFGLIKD